MTHDLAERLLASKSSSWNPLNYAWAGSFYYAGQLVDSPLCALKPMRDGIVALLLDNRKVGEVWRDDKGQVSYKGAQSSGGMGFQAVTGEEEARAPKAGTKLPYRMCDVLAGELTQFKDAPAYRPYWSEADRDAAIQKVIAYVRNAGEKLVELRPDFKKRFDLSED